MTFLIIDNYDSFVHNLARYFELSGTSCVIVRNDEVSVEDVFQMNPQAIVVSPGPCTPDDAGQCLDIVKECGKTIPVFGVCLGHQIIAQTYGAQTVPSNKWMHGQSSTITHDEKELFQNIPSPTTVGRYHSLTNQVQGCNELLVTALSDDNVVMAIKHKTYPIYGVQFHPESILSEHGLQIVENFIQIAKGFHQSKEAA